MRKIMIPILLLAISFSANSDQKPGSDRGNLTIEAYSFEHDRGVAVAYLFYEGQDVMKINQNTPVTKAIIKNGKAKLSFRDLPFSNYGVTVFHDENNNSILDHSFGIPAEPMGFSNDFKMSVFAGLPNFDKMKFKFSKGGDTISVTVK